jgi:hypothetical protein
MEEKIAMNKSIYFLDLAFQDTPARWLTTHKPIIMEWEEAKQAILCRFQSRDQLKEEMNIYFQDAQLFDGWSDPKVHIEDFLKQWQSCGSTLSPMGSVIYPFVGSNPKILVYT